MKAAPRFNKPGRGARVGSGAWSSPTSVSELMQWVAAAKADPSVMAGMVIVCKYRSAHVLNLPLEQPGWLAKQLQQLQAPLALDGRSLAALLRRLPMLLKVKPASLTARIRLVVEVLQRNGLPCVIQRPVVRLARPRTRRVANDYDDAEAPGLHDACGTGSSGSDDEDECAGEQSDTDATWVAQIPAARVQAKRHGAIAATNRATPAEDNPPCDAVAARAFVLRMLSHCPTLARARHASLVARVDLLAAYSRQVPEFWAQVRHFNAVDMAMVLMMSTTHFHRLAFLASLSPSPSSCDVRLAVCLSPKKFSKAYPTYAEFMTSGRM
ncbi:hypothetical protein V8C86DRAFT_2476046 [Haematococcus lacustris]